MGEAERATRGGPCGRHNMLALETREDACVGCSFYGANVQIQVNSSERTDNDAMRRGVTVRARCATAEEPEGPANKFEDTTVR